MMYLGLKRSPSLKAIKRYRVTLTDEERSTLHTLIDAGTYKKTKRKRAQALLADDESDAGDDRDHARLCSVSTHG